MLKWALLLAVLVFAAWWWGRAHRLRSRSAPGPAAGAGPGTGARTHPAEMVRCAHCGLHLPAPDALTEPSSGRPYCSEAHRRLGPSSAFTSVHPPGDDPR